MIINFDYDDVLFDLQTPWVKKLNNTYGTNVTEITNWEIADFFPSLTKSQVFAPLCEDAFWETVQPTANGVLTVNNLLKDGHEVNVITSTHYRNVTAKMHRLFKIYRKIKWKNVIITANKQRVKCDILIDDNTDNLTGGAYIKLLFNRPHNRSFDAEKNGMKRIYDLREVYDFVRKYESR